MNPASRKALEAALKAAEAYVSGSEDEVRALENTLATAQTRKEENEQAITELKAELEAEEELPPPPPEAEG